MVYDWRDRIRDRSPPMFKSTRPKRIPLPKAYTADEKAAIAEFERAQKVKRVAEPIAAMQLRSDSKWIRRQVKKKIDAIVRQHWPMLNVSVPYIASLCNCSPRYVYVRAAKMKLPTREQMALDAQRVERAARKWVTLKKEGKL